MIVWPFCTTFASLFLEWPICCTKAERKKPSFPLSRSPGRLTQYQSWYAWLTVNPWRMVVFFNPLHGPFPKRGVFLESNSMDFEKKGDIYWWKTPRIDKKQRGGWATVGILSNKCGCRLDDYQGRLQPTGPQSWWPSLKGIYQAA